MGSFISRNSLASLFFLGLILYGISVLVGSENEEGVLMKLARDYSGKAEVTAATQTQPSAVAPPVAPPPSVSEAPEAEFLDDSELLDPATGYNPSPNLGGDIQPDSESDETLILPQGDGGPAPSPGAPVAGGALVPVGANNE